MKTKTKNRKNSFLVLLLASLLALVNVGWAQTICTDNVNTAYGLSTSGALYPINLTTGAVGTVVESLTDGTNAAINANSIGYNSVNGRFYYFYRCSAGATPLSEFVSYNPSTNTLQVLTTPPFGTTTKIRSGCVNNSGTGYYCIDIVSSTPSLWYYNISAATWTKISSVFKNGATDYTATFQSLNSGDMAFDKLGNLWIVVSNSANYAMYKIPNPVPTTAQGATGITNVSQIIATTPTPGGVSLTGLSFNANGVAYLTSGSGVGANNNMLYKMTTSTSGLTYVATLSLNGAGDDLTSCVFSFVLPVKWIRFSADFIKNKGVQLKWDVAEDNSVTRYHIERSTNTNHWERLASVQRKMYAGASQASYEFTDFDFLPGTVYYRIVEEDATGNTHSSEIRKVITEDEAFSISPNPAKDKLTIKLKTPQATRVEIYNNNGMLVRSTTINRSGESIDISTFVKGNYFLRLSVDGVETAHGSFIKL
jgi:hypothetical protein